MKQIGDTFGDELEAAGLAGLPFSWGTDGRIEYSITMTAEQISGVESVYEAHDPGVDAIGP